MKTIMTRLSSMVAVFSLLLLPAVASALTLTPPGNSIDTGTTEDLSELVVRVIQYLLGFLGLIAVIMIIIGGFRWMTAGGNEEKIESAKKVISAAVIGLVIVLIAWAIVFFVGQAIL